MWLKEFITGLNSYAGLFALLALVAAVVVPIRISRKQTKDRRHEMRQDMKDELEAINESSRLSGMTHEEREHYTKKRTLEKGMKRR